MNAQSLACILGGDPKPATAGETKTVFIPDGYESKLDALMAVIRFGPAVLPAPQALVLLYHAERTLAFNKGKDATSIGQMMNGIRRRDGSWIRAGCGLRKSALVAANAVLSKLKLLKRVRRSSAKRGNLPTEYEVDWGAVKRFIETRLAELSAAPLVRNTDKPPCPRHGEALVRNTHTQSSCLQSSSSLRQSKNPLKESGKIRGVVGSNRHPSKPEEKAASFSLKPDDDGGTPKRESNPDPKQEFRLRLSERHGDALDIDQVVADVRLELDRGNASWEDLIVADTKQTTNPRGLTNPHGHYRKLARKASPTLMALRQQRARVDAFLNPRAPDVAKCPSCNNGKRASGEYCTCRGGELRRQVENNGKVAIA